MQEKRLTTRLTTYWDLLRKELVMPNFQRINSGALQDVWMFCMSLKLEPGADNTDRKFRITQLGDELKKMYGEDVSGQVVSAKQRQFKAAKLVFKAHEILDNPAPLYDEGQFVSERNKIVKYRSVALPFGDEETGEVTHLLAGISWREF